MTRKTGVQHHPVPSESQCSHISLDWPITIITATRHSSPSMFHIYPNCNKCQAMRLNRDGKSDFQMNAASLITDIDWPIEVDMSN